jgi:hypothetical protein
MNAVFALFLLVLLGCGLFFLFRPVYFTQEHLGPDITALWHDEELYVFFGTEKTVDKGKFWQFLLSRIGVPGFETERRTRPRAQVVHVNNRTVQKYVQDDFNMRGQIYPINNAFYLIQGGRKISTFRWEGNRFVELPAEQRERIIRPADLDKKVIRAQGWHKLDWEDFGGIGNVYDKSFPIKLNNLDATLQIESREINSSLKGGEAHFRRVKIVLRIGQTENVVLDLNEDIILSFLCDDASVDIGQFQNPQVEGGGAPRMPRGTW